ncbi:ras-related protein Rab-13-like [Saccostrea echinata]|uniref:ras-related protein Rab-13-like n=1 Tax=Saccostrea echinata TaxID=191078 RepID=UPI002A802041|nr:ras-related protein Rab-13-like [Saccostrea echinata]
MGASVSNSGDRDKQLIRKVRIALVGTYAVGKTSIITRYIRETFSSEYIYTRGGNINKKFITVYGQKLQIELIDTGGQDYQKEIAPTLYKVAQGILIVHDISKPSSFEDVEEWLTGIRQKTLGDPVIMLIGNKNDLDPQGKTDDPPTKNTNLTTGLTRVSYEQCEKKVHQEGLLPFYSEVSAKTGMNIDPVFELLVKEILHKQHRLLGSIWEPDLGKDVVGRSAEDKTSSKSFTCTIL